MRYFFRFIALPKESVSLNEASLGNNEDLHAFDSKIVDLNSNESIVVTFTEEEINSKLQNYFDIENKYRQEEKSLWTMFFKPVDNRIILSRVALSEDTARLYVSWDDGDNWIIFYLKNIEKDGRQELKVVAMDSRLPTFVEERIINDINNGIYGAAQDFYRLNPEGVFVDEMIFYENEIVVTREGPEQSL